MSSPPLPIAAREIALLALSRAASVGTYVQDELHTLLEAHDLPPAERGLATEIALGTMRHRRTLDWLLRQRLRRPIHTLDAATLNVLRTAAYQIVFLDRVPDYAAVDEAVSLVRKHAETRLAGLANAVLRRLPTLFDPQTPPERVRNPRRLLPLPHSRTLVLAEGRLPDDELQRLAIVYSFPDVLVRRWYRRWGGRRLRKVLESLNEPPRVFGRVNTLRANPAEVAARLPHELRERARTPSDNVLDLSDVSHDLLMCLLSHGLVTVEDPTATLAVDAMELRPGQTVLDLCASPGGKCSYAAELLKGQGTLWALDRGRERLALLEQTVSRLGLRIVRVAPNEPASWERMPALFDRVLVDVPCSNTGVLNRRADARWRFSVETLASLASLQRQLLAQAAAATRVGGLCVYSTCSLEPEENGDLVRRFLAETPAMVLQMERETFPSSAGDGGYLARLIRVGTA